MITCAVCGDPVDPTDPNTWQGEHSWFRIAGERPSGRHGGRDHRNATPLQEWAHGGCLYLEKNGLLGQEQLV